MCFVRRVSGFFAIVVFCLVVVDLGSSRWRSTLDGVMGMSIGSSAKSVECSFLLAACFILRVCDPRHSTASFERDTVGVKSGRVSTVQSSWAAKCAFRFGQAVG